jgi:phage regulator Rha-like protein
MGGKQMKELIPKDKYGIFADTKDTARVDSKFVAQFFEKEHKNVLRDIARITDPTSGLRSKFEGVKLPLSQRYRVRPEFCRNSKTIERPKWTREQS